MAIPAELAYFFRQPILRDAAYQLQVPSERAKLHRMALEILEAMFEGPPPEPQADMWGDLKCEPHPTDPVAADLAEHALGVRMWEGDEDGSLRAREILYLRRAAEYAERQFNNDDAVRLWQGLAATVEKSAPSTAAEALRRAGVVLGNAGRASEAEHLFESARDAAIGTGDRKTVGYALANLGAVFEMAGRGEAAERSYLQALAIHREVGNRRAEGILLGNLAVVYWQTGRVDEAETTIKKALAIHREVGNRRSEGMALANLATSWWQTGRFAEAEAKIEQALSIHREMGSRHSEGTALGCLAGVYFKTKRFADAEEMFSKALEIHREVGSRRSEAIAMGNLASVYQAKGEEEAALSLFEEALDVHRDVGNRRFEGAHSCYYALSLLALQRAKAKEVWQSGADILKQIGDTVALNRQTNEMREACAEAGVEPFDR